MCKKPPAGGHKPPNVWACDCSIEVPRHCRPESLAQLGRITSLSEVRGQRAGTPGRGRHLLSDHHRPASRAEGDHVCDALTRRIHGLPDGAIRTLTWDQGREIARRQRLTRDTDVEVFFAHPYSSWEKGTNENTNRLICRHLLKGPPSPATNPTSTPSPTN